MLLSILWYTGQAPTTQHHQTQNAANVQAEEPYSGKLISQLVQLSTALNQDGQSNYLPGPTQEAAGILELRRGIQDASCVGPGKSNLPFELRRKAGDCSRVTAGPIDLI